MLSLLEQADRRAQDDEEITKPQPHDFLWPINVYASNMLTDKTLVALHANCEVMQQTGLQGAADIYRFLINGMPT